MYWSLVTGSIDISQSDVFKSVSSFFGAVVNQENEMNVMIINHIRFPRLLLAFIVGSSLSICGAAMQGLFRNPLADPALIGVSTGAALGAVAFIVLGSTFFPDIPSEYKIFSLPIVAFIGGLISTLLAYRLALRSGITNIAILLLSGIAINALNGALYGFFVFVADDAQLRNITFWSLGSFSGANWQSVYISFFVVFIPSLFLLQFGKELNIISLGEKEAYFLGLNVERTKLIVITITAITVGGGVSLVGIVGFLGIVTPHIIRLWISYDYRYLLPLSVFVGGIVLVIADTLSRTIVSPAELPVGILTTGIGGPFFIWLLLREKKKEEVG